jgi:hypothetical protein
MALSLCRDAGERGVHSLSGSFNGKFSIQESVEQEKRTGHDELRRVSSGNSN